jgi:hypothetical protein
MDGSREMFEAPKRTADESIRVNQGVRQKMDAALRVKEAPGTLRAAVERLDRAVRDLARALEERLERPKMEGENPN